MKVTLKLNETAKIAKREDPCEDCHYLYFKLWQKGDKSRVYINDYKRRTIGYIDTVSDETIINDNQGNYGEEIEYAINGFMAEYAGEGTTPKQSEPEQPEKIKVKLAPNEEVPIKRNSYPCDRCYFINFKLWQKNGKSRVYMSDYKYRTIGYIDTVSGETVINDNQGITDESIEYAIKIFMATYTEQETAEAAPEQPERALKITGFAKRQVMKRAWEIAKQGVAKFGGKVREYFAESLKMAWAEMKETLTLAKRVRSLVKAYNLKTFYNCDKGKFNLKVNESIKNSPEDITFVKSHKAEIINFLTSDMVYCF